jgi:hypothetical protein
MKILVDADACPVIKIVEKLACEFNLELIIFADIYHNIEIGYGKLIQVDKGFQAVDMNIANGCQKNDIVITQDYGLASLVLGRGALVLNYDGQHFTKENIDYLLMKRHLYAKIRRGKGRHKGPNKRTNLDDLNFENSLRDTINSIL